MSDEYQQEQEKQRIAAGTGLFSGNGSVICRCFYLLAQNDQRIIIRCRIMLLKE
jgi:hypothetical protein